jgi:hypothetical protein
MSASIELSDYVTALGQALVAAGADGDDVAALVSAANRIRGYLDDPSTLTAAAWAQARADWEEKRRAIQGQLKSAILGELANIPGLSQSLGDLEKFASTGLRAEFNLGPVRIAAGTTVLYIEPPPLAGTQLDVIPIGPFQLGLLEANIAPPFGGGPSLPGGGSLVRLSEEKAWGGHIDVPLPPVLVSASAVLEIDGSDPSFLAVLGIGFSPPIQLSFGFSLDRVGGIVGINRTMDVDQLSNAIRTGVASDALFQLRPPDDPGGFAAVLSRIFPKRIGSHLVGPSMKLSWLSMGANASLVSLDLAVVVQFPEVRIAILGVARMSIPRAPTLMSFRLDVLGIIDPVEQLVTIDATLVDSHVLGIFQVYGDAALRLSWGSQAYTVLAIGGFFPGFDPKPAKLPALRRVGMAQTLPAGLSMRVEGYFAVTSNSIQFGGRIEVNISLIIKAHGFIEADALVQFRPFRFQARIAAGFSVSVAGISVASVTLSGQISGPGPMTIHGALSISVFLFEISWDQTFVIGSGPADALPASRPLIELVVEVLSEKGSVRATSTTDPHVVLAPGTPKLGYALVPPTGALALQQRLVPLGVPVDRVSCVPLPQRASVHIVGAGAEVEDGFAPATFLNLTDAELLNRMPFEDLPAGRLLTPDQPELDAFTHLDDNRQVDQIVIDTRHPELHLIAVEGVLLDLMGAAAMIQAARDTPAVSDPTPVLSYAREQWTAIGTGNVLNSATAAHEFARDQSRRAKQVTVAVPVADLDQPVVLAGVV